MFRQHFVHSALFGPCTLTYHSWVSQSEITTGQKAYSQGVCFSATNYSSTPMHLALPLRHQFNNLTDIFIFLSSFSPLSFCRPPRCMATQTMCCLKSISGRDVKGCTVGKGQCSQRWMYCWRKRSLCAEEGGDCICWFQGHCPKPFEAAGKSWR